ncbi:MAG: KpsF/GutQ family sugar-phosphate isomerase [Pseudomonadota bacterium]|nr:KpsF/GutQ family sugar-phosphate isomerase [Pseudomonadota bacterium]
MTDDELTLEGKKVLQIEADAVAALSDRLAGNFAGACRAILACTGRVVVVGMGKSGHIGSKIAATLASTGTPSFFVHPGEASHGDLGMITPDDLVIAISNSGNTPEILAILPMIRRLSVPLVSMTGTTDNPLCKQADYCLDVGVEKEACPLNLAPTASTTAALAMGDALAVALLKARNFTANDFARSHPGGALGRRLLLYVRDVMQSGSHIPLVNIDDSLQAALLEMSSKGLGMTGIIDEDGKLVGIITDGDLRRTLNKGIDLYSAKVAEVMTVGPTVTSDDQLAAEVVNMMQDLSINSMLAVDKEHRPVGALNMHDLLRAGLL